MNASKAPSGIFRTLLCGILGTFLLIGAVPAHAAKYTNQSPLSFAWGEASGAVDHYNVYVSVDGQPFELLEQADGCACEVPAQDGRTYVLQVEAEDASGRVGPMSNPSDQVIVYLNGSAVDTDGDGMSNSWETSHGLNPFDPSDAQGDLDGDGVTNLAEFDAGTDPGEEDTDGDGSPDGEDPFPLDPLNGGSRPVADAGEDQELDPTVVTLDGSGSHDPDGDLLSYTWSQKQGPEVTLSDTHTVSPAFLAKKSGQYRFELVVSGGGQTSLPDEVIVFIRNVPPAADAGEDFEMIVGTVAVLDGSGSADPNEDPVTFSWTQSLGLPVTLEGGTNQTATFVPESQGIYGFQLVTSDGLHESPPDEVWVIVNSLTNRVPTADAGEDQTVTEGDTVTLNGSASFDPDGDPLTYTWSQVSGPESVVLEGAATVQARFEAPDPGIYEFHLMVHDGEVSSGPNGVLVTVESGENRTPVAHIEYVDPVEAGDWVSLDGSGSYDPDQDPLIYTWVQTMGPLVMLEDTDRAVAGFYAVAEGTMAFELVVSDGQAESTPDSVRVQVLPGDPDQARPPQGSVQSQSDGGGAGCSVGLGGSSQHETNASDIGYLVTLFLPAIGALMYQRRRLRTRKRMQG
jgi:hypothetical protein